MPLVLGNQAGIVAASVAVLALVILGGWLLRRAHAAAAAAQLDAQRIRDEVQSMWRGAEEKARLQAEAEREAVEDRLREAHEVLQEERAIIASMESSLPSVTGFDQFEFRKSEEDL